MIKNCVTPQDAVDFLNGLIDLDRESVVELMRTRVPCNEKLADHPTVQVAEDEEGYLDVGFIGILNGLFGVDENDCGIIGAVYYGTELSHFSLLEEKDGVYASIIEPYE